MTSPAASQLPAASTGHLPRGIQALGAVLLLMTAAFCVLLWPEWSQNPDLSHGFFAPVVFLLLLWESRRAGTPRWVPAGRYPPELLFVFSCLAGFALFGLAGIFAASLAWNHALVSLLIAASLCSFLLGGLLILADERVRLVPFNWISLTAIFLWILISPMPDGTYARLTLGLQGFVSDNVLRTLHLLGIPARQHGNIIELARTSVGVEEACSGIRSLLSCVYAGFFFAAWQVRRPGGRLFLIVAAPVLALGMNFLRSLTLTLLANAGHKIEGFWHDATGFAILGVTALVLAGLAVLLESKPAPPPPDTASPAASPARWPLQVFWGSILATLILAGFFFINSRPSPRSGRPVPVLTEILPAHAEGWKAITPKDLYRFADILNTSHLIERTYVRTNDEGRLTQLTVYVAYWAPGQASVSRVASHTPDACWPGSGWTARPVTDEQLVPQLPGATVFPAEQRLFQNADGYPQHVWFWHIYDGRVINYQDPYSVSALFQLALQYGFRRQGDQFFVRVSSNRPWSELAGEPLVGEIFANLARIGL